MQRKKTVLITGITGQDGAYLSQLLLQHDYSVVGIVRGYTNSSFAGLEYLGIKKDVTIVECDLLDLSHIIKILKEYQPDEIYNLAAQSSVSLSFAQPIGTVTFNTLSVFNLLEAIRLTDPKIKFYQASSSEMYGQVKGLPITEESYINPVSPYAVSKAAAHWTCTNYRNTFNMFICCGILFNHESVLRSGNFFIKKVISDSIRISHGQADKLEVGNIDIRRDFGYAPAYVHAMFLMMQHEHPDSYVICSGRSVSLREIIEIVFDRFEIPASRLTINRQFFRPSEIKDIYGCSKKAEDAFNWRYTLDAKSLIHLLIDEELKLYA
jgi:GDPmannose 4,6-dehydratase